MEMIWGVHLPVEYVIRLQLMAGVYRFSRYFLQMNIFMIAKYCINRCTNDVERKVTFTPEEVCNLTVEFFT